MVMSKGVTSFKVLPGIQITVLQYKLLVRGMMHGVLNISDISRIKWNGQDGAPQSSFCSVECLFGEYREYIQSQAECCWTCQPCTGAKQVSDGIECKTCPPGYIPNAQLSDCQPIPPDYLHWTHPWAILIMMLSFAGCSSAVVMIIIWILKWKTKVIKATSSNSVVSCWVPFSSAMLFHSFTLYNQHLPCVQ